MLPRANEGNTPGITRGHTRESKMGLISQRRYNARLSGDRDGPEATHLTTLADINPESVAWLWPGRIPFGKITIIEGDPGLGKSTLALDIAARLTRCSPMPGESRSVHGSVILLTAEDGLADTVRPRFDAAGGDARWVHSFQVDGPHGQELPTFPQNAEELEIVIRDTYAKLVILDPLVAFLDAANNSWKDADVRRALSPLARVAEETGAALLTIRHLTKSFGGPAIYRGGGSIGIVGAARSALLIASDPTNSDRRVLASVKSNLAPTPVSLAFSIIPRGSSSGVSWHGESDCTADDLLLPPEVRVGELSPAEASLKELLAREPMDRRQVVERMVQNKFSERSTDRAARRLGVIRRSHGFGAERSATWRLPNPATVQSVGGNDENGKNGTNGKNGGNGGNGGNNHSVSANPAIQDNHAIYEPGGAHAPGERAVRVAAQ